MQQRMQNLGCVRIYLQHLEVVLVGLLQDQEGGMQVRPYRNLKRKELGLLLEQDYNHFHILRLFQDWFLRRQEVNELFKETPLLRLLEECNLALDKSRETRHIAVHASPMIPA